MGWVGIVGVLVEEWGVGGGEYVETALGGVCVIKVDSG